MEENKNVNQSDKAPEVVKPILTETPEVIKEVSPSAETNTSNKAPVAKFRSNDGNKRFPRKDGKREFKKSFEPKKKLLEEKVVSIARVTKVTKGGRHYRFAATMAVGDMKGLVGIGTGKSNELPEAIKKGIQVANKNLVKISLIDGRTIPHEAIGTCGRARVLIKPAKEGTGVIAGGAVRAILELAGVKDIVSKSLGANTQANVAKAALDALQSVRMPEHIAELRGKTKEEL